MKKLTKVLSFAIFLPVTALTGCGSSDGADATAEAIVLSGVAKSADNDQMLEMFKQQPEFKNMVACFSRSLSDQGWTGSDHDNYMDATGGTGDFRMIDNNQYSEAEAMEKFGAIAMASSTCM